MRTVVVLGVTALASSLTLSFGLPSAVADTSVGGFLYRDLDNDGIRDEGEPPLPGIVLRSGARSAITDAVGHYDFLNVTSTISIRADTGWFRSQCSAAYSGPSSGSAYTSVCPDPGAGAGADQQFRVNNQLLTATAPPGTTASLGLTPDWVGVGYANYSTAAAAGNRRDPAMRLSPGYRMPAAESDCLNFVCRPGQTQWALTQWLNQGTTRLKGLRAVVTAPPGSMITHVRPYYGYQSGSGHAVSNFTVLDVESDATLTRTDEGELSAPSSRIRIVLKGPLVAGGEYLTAVAYRMADDAAFSDGNNDGLPDCSADTGMAYPGQTCNKATDNSPGSYISWGGITRIKDNRRDIDSTFCPLIPDACPVLGVHDKTKRGDSNDSAAWKVDAAEAP